MIGRLAVSLGLAGLLAGLLLRAVAGRDRMRGVARVGMALPLLLHAGFVTVQALGNGGGSWRLAAYLAAAGLVGALGVVAAGRWSRSHRLWLALSPLAAAALYLALPFALVSLGLRAQGIDLDVVPTAAYAAAALFVTAVLLPFVPSGPVAIAELLRRRRR